MMELCFFVGSIDDSFGRRVGVELRQGKDLGRGFFLRFECTVTGKACLV